MFFGIKFQNMAGMLTQTRSSFQNCGFDVEKMNELFWLTMGYKNSAKQISEHLLYITYSFHCIRLLHYIK